MDLDRLTTVVRPRSRWEAADMGLLMARAWWWPLTQVWLVITLPIVLFLHLVLYDYPFIAIMIVWWLKPIWERPLLHILSQAIFGEIPTLKETLRAFPKLAAKQWFASLTWRRLSPSRSMDLAVVQLESLKGKQRTKRLDVLHGVRSTGAGWLTIIGVHIETAISIAMLALIVLLIPTELAIDWQALFFEESAEMWLLNNVGAYVAMTLVAPFYVAAGFSLYIHRRIWLEGWDIEIVFRRLQRRLNGSPNGTTNIAASLVLALATLFASFGGADYAMAQQVVTPEQSKTAIEAVLERDEFHEREINRTPKWPWEWDDDEENLDSDMPEWLATFFVWLFEHFRILLWALCIALILIFLVKNRAWLNRYASQFSSGKKQDEVAPPVLFGLEVGSESLPEDVLGEVAALWQKEDHRAALSLLYRATLTHLMEQHSIKFRDGYTEGDCVRLVVASTTEELSSFFYNLTNHWQRLAYAHQLPDSSVMGELCLDWKNYFGEGRDERRNPE